MNLASLLSDLSSLALAPPAAAAALTSARPSSNTNEITHAEQDTDEADPDPNLRRAKRLLALHKHFAGSRDAELTAAREAVAAVARGRGGQDVGAGGIEEVGEADRGSGSGSASRGERGSEERTIGKDAGQEDDFEAWA